MVRRTADIKARIITWSLDLDQLLGLLTSTVNDPLAFAGNLAAGASVKDSNASKRARLISNRMLEPGLYY